MRRRERGRCLDPLVVVVLAVLLPSTAWCIPHLGVSCVERNSNRIGAITHNSNRGNSSSNRHNSSSSGSIMLLHHHRSRLQLGRHSSFPLATFHASTVGRWGTLLENAANPSKPTHCKLQHLWSISRGANRRVLHHGLAVPTTSPWRGFPREKC
jgi:hypothetical protein